MGVRANIGDAWDALRGHKERGNPVGGALFDNMAKSWGTGDAWAKTSYGSYYPSSVSVYAAVKLRQEAIAGVPLFVYRQTNEGLEQVDPDHQLQQLLNRVNRWWTRGDLWRATETYLSLWGSAYWALTRESGAITEIWPLRPDKMKVLPDAKDYIKGFVYGSGTDRRAFAPDEIVWFRYFNPLDEYAGLSPVAPVALSVDMGVDALKTNRFALANDTAPGMVINVSDTPSDEEVMSFYQRWEQRFMGPSKARRPAILSEGMTASNLGFSPKDMMALESMRWSVEDVARVFNVPTPMLHDLSRATYANIMTARKSFWEDCIVPQLHFYEEELTELLLPLMGEEGLVVRFDTSEVAALQEDEDAKAKRRDIYIKSGVMSVNEVRADMGLEATGSVISYPTLAAIGAGVLTVNEVRHDMGMAPVEWGDKPPAAAGPSAMSITDDIASTRAVVEPEHEDWEEYGRAIDTEQRRKGKRLEGEFRKDISVLFRKQLNSVIREFEKQEELVRDIGVNGTNGSTPVAAMRAAPIIDHSFAPQFTQTISKYLTKGVLDGALRTGESLTGKLKLVTSFDITAPHVTNWIETRSKWWTKTVMDGTEKKVLQIVSDGRTAGLGPFEIAKNLRGYREFATTARSERVARTEMTVAQNQGNLQQFRQAGVEGKRWWTAEDERTRETHLDAHGQTVQLSEMFQVGLDAMDGPGQGSDPAENINCRCVVIPPARDWRPGDVKEKQPAESKIPLTDKGTIDINAFQPQVKRVAGVPNAAVETAQNATRQTIQSLRPEVAKKLIKLVHDSKRRTTVVKANSRHLTRQGEGCVGVYKHTEDATWVSGYHSYFATHHELGHQLTARTGRLAEILGKKKAPQFMAEIEERFKMVQLGKATPVTEYSTKSVKEYIAEAFKYAITDPKKVRDTDPITLKIMRKYFVKEDPVKFTHVPGFMGPIRALLGNLIKMEVPA